MDRAELQLKKNDLLKQIEELKRKVVSIDDVLSMFPHDEAPLLKGMGRYVSMGITEAIIDACKQASPSPITASSLEAILLREGLKSKAANLKNMITVVADRLVKEGRISRGTIGGMKAFYAPSESGGL